MQLSNPRHFPLEADHAGNLTGDKDTQTRGKIIAIFDERYTQNGHLVFAATKHLMKPFTPGMGCHVICRGKYRGPRFGHADRVKVTGYAVTPRAFGRRLRDVIARRLARLHLTDSPGRWTSNIDLADEPVLEALYSADDAHAVVVFTSDPAYGLRIARS